MVIDGAKTVDNVGYSRAFFEVYPGAVFVAQGKQYLVESLNIESKTAHCRAAHLSYHTAASDFTDINVLHALELPTMTPDAYSLFEFGVVQVVKRNHGFKKIDNLSGDVIEDVDLSLPPIEMETKAVWIDIPSGVIRALESNHIDSKEAIHSVGHVLQAVAELTCQAAGDVASQCFSSPHEKRILLYDKRPGGLGFCEALLARQTETLDKAIELVRSCPCKAGCPSCLFISKCSRYNQGLCKRGGLALLTLMLKKSQKSTVVANAGAEDDSPRKVRRATASAAARFPPQGRAASERPSIMKSWGLLDKTTFE